MKFAVATNEILVWPKALHRAGLDAGALDTDDLRAAGDAFASLRSRSLAAQVRVHVSTERDRLLLEWSCWSLDFFSTSPNHHRVLSEHPKMFIKLQGHVFDNF